MVNKKIRKTFYHVREQNQSLRQDVCWYFGVVNTNKKDIFSFPGTEPVTGTGCLLLSLSRHLNIRKFFSTFRKQNQSLTQDDCCYVCVVNTKNEQMIYSFSETEPVTDTGCLLLFLGAQ